MRLRLCIIVIVATGVIALGVISWGRARKDARAAPAGVDAKPVRAEDSGRSRERIAPASVVPVVPSNPSELLAKYRRAHADFLSNLCGLVDGKDLQAAYQLAVAAIRARPASIEEKALAVCALRALPFLAAYSGKIDDAYKLLRDVACRTDGDLECRCIALASIAGTDDGNGHVEPLVVSDPETGARELVWNLAFIRPSEMDVEPGACDRRYIFCGNLREAMARDSSLRQWLAEETASSGPQTLRQSAITALTRYPDAETTITLAPLLDNERDASLRRIVALALSRLAQDGVSTAAQTLVNRGLQDTDPNIRALGLQHLPRVSPRYEPEVGARILNALDVTAPSGDAGLRVLVSAGFEAVVRYYNQQRGQGQVVELVDAFARKLATWDNPPIDACADVLDQLRFRHTPIRELQAALERLPQSRAKTRAAETLARLSGERLKD